MTGADDGRGSGLRLIEARQRIRHAVLAIIAAESAPRVDAAWAGSEEAERAYVELAGAAAELVAAEEAWDEHRRAVAERLNASRVKSA